MIQNPIFVLARLIREEFGLTNEQVMTSNITNEYLKSNTSNLFITIQMASRLPIAQQIQQQHTLTTSKETKAIWRQSQYSIDVISKNLEAIDASLKIELALISTKKRMLCDQYQIKIHDQIDGNVIDLSAIEGGMILKRFRMNVNIAHQYIIESNIDYYNTFGPVVFTHEK